MEKKKVYDVGYKMGAILALIFALCVSLIFIASTIKFIMWLLF